MRQVRWVAVSVLLLVAGASLAAGWLDLAPYETQFRDAVNAGPSRQFPLGTDELGRDRLSRLLQGTRVSLLLAPAAALLATATAALIGGVAGFMGGWVEKIILRVLDLFLSLPWLFLLLTVRAALPLNASPWTSVVITFSLLGLLGWAGPARVVRSQVRSLMNSEFVLRARASGLSPARLLVIEILPNLRPVLAAQFWISVPVFILSEANLGLLGLGVAEPLPSWGSLLRDLENVHAVSANLWMLAPVGLLALVMSCFQILAPGEDLLP